MLTKTTATIDNCGVLVIDLENGFAVIEAIKYTDTGIARNSILLSKKAVQEIVPLLLDYLETQNGNNT